MGNQNNVKFVYSEHIWNQYYISFLLRMLFVITVMIRTYKLSFGTNSSVIVNKWGTYRQVNFCNYWSLLGTVKLVHNDHPWDPKFVAVVDRWSLLTGGRCSEVALCYENWNWDPKIVVAVDKWSLFGGGR